MLLRQRPVIAYRLVFAVLGLAAVGVQYAHASKLAGFSPFNFFGYFTVLINVFSIFMLGYGAWLGIMGRPPTRRYEWTRGADTALFTLADVVFLVLLASGPCGADSTLGWVDIVVHHIMPVAVLADWLLVPPRHRLGGKDLLSWLAIPAVYFADTLIRGAGTGWYPYPFFDVTIHGYPK